MMKHSNKTLILDGFQFHEYYDFLLALYLHFSCILFLVAMMVSGKSSRIMEGPEEVLYTKDCSFRNRKVQRKWRDMLLHWHPA